LNSESEVAGEQEREVGREVDEKLGDEHPEEFIVVECDVDIDEVSDGGKQEDDDDDDDEENVESGDSSLCDCRVWE